MSTAQPNYATIAEYFRQGLKLGLLNPESARAWADSIIKDLDEPPAEIIEVSWSKGMSELLEALNSVEGSRDTALAGKWLLGFLRESISNSDGQLTWAVQRAMQVARSTGLGDDVYYDFDIIDDALSLAKNNTYGTVAECRKNLENALSSYPNPPINGET